MIITLYNAVTLGQVRGMLLATLYKIIIMTQIKNTPETNDEKLFVFPHLKGRALPQDNFIGGKFVPPVKGQYFDNISGVNGKVFPEPQSQHRKTLIWR